MKRKISWHSMELDEIELVYQKAEESPDLSELMERLEAQALSEAKENIGMLKTDKGELLTPDRFEGLSENDRETVIKVLGNAGLAGLNMDREAGVITCRFSGLIPRVQACTIFNLLNRLEKLDGAVTVQKPSWTLQFQVPLGGRSGLMLWEMMIMRLYPWLSVQETSFGETVLEPSDPSPIFEAKKEETAEKVREPAAEKKKSFWQKLFGK